MPMTLIQRQTLSGSQASVTFSNIPQNYQTLKILVSARNDNASNARYVFATFNTSTSSFTGKNLEGSGSAAASDSTARYFGITVAASATASTFSNFEVVIPNYNGSANKAYSHDAVVENNATASYQTLYAGLWSNTSALSSISIASDLGNFVANSTFSLYGIS